MELTDKKELTLRRNALFIFWIVRRKVFREEKQRSCDVGEERKVLRSFYLLLYFYIIIKITLLKRTKKKVKRPKSI